METIIFDIDGTLADISHRVHFVTNGNKDWNAFFGCMAEDKPNPSVVELSKALVFYANVWGKFKFVIASGRPDNYREVTEAWLQANAPSLFTSASFILMRKAGDHRADVIVKREMLRYLREMGMNPTTAVDDRPSVIAMWKEEGLNVMEIKGNWDEKPEYDPGDLVLLIGPSGAGKSSHALDHFLYEEIVSSDDLREQLTGDHRDQSMNNQMWAALHAIVAARIKHGLHTIVDATNIHAADRRKLRDLVPQNGRIEYVVIDRPLADKHRDAGWRDAVIINGEKLIDKHHRSFQSALPNILRGDDDPRVTVLDARLK